MVSGTIELLPQLRALKINELASTFDQLERLKNAPVAYAGGVMLGDLFFSFTISGADQEQKWCWSNLRRCSKY